MPTNLSLLGRAFRLLLGFLLTTWAVAGGPAWGYVGVYFLFVGSFGFSPLKSLFSSGSGDSSRDTKF